MSFKVDRRPGCRREGHGGKVGQRAVADCDQLGLARCQLGNYSALAKSGVGTSRSRRCSVHTRAFSIG